MTLAESTRRKPADKLPITHHPLFPVMIVLWCGALLGLASLAIRPALIEGVVLATGLDQVIPKAAPPLGNTTRLLIAMMMTALGCVIGLVIARRFTAGSQASAASSRRRRTAGAEGASPVALFGARAAKDEDDELDEAPVRKRQLTIASEQDDFAEHAPLPGSGQILQVADLGLASFDEEQETWLRSTRRREVPEQHVIVDWDTQEDVEPDHASAPTDSVAVAEPGPASSDDDFQPMREDGFVETGSVETASVEADETTGASHVEGQPSNRLFEVYARRVNAGPGSNDASSPQPGFVSLPELADASEAETPPHADTVGAAWIEPAQQETPTAPTLAGPEISPAAQAASADERAWANAAERIAAAPLDALSHVELLERLGQTIARRRTEWARAERARAEAEAEAARQMRAAPETPIEEPTASPAQEPAAEIRDMPLAMRAHWHQDDEDEAGEDALPGYVPPRHIALKSVPTPQAMAARDSGADEEDDILAAGYSSLLGMTKATSRIEPMAAPIGQPPVYAFPAPRPQASTDEAQEQATAAPATASVPTPRPFDAPATPAQTADATEQALRAALATLQRMSGAA